MTLFTHHDLRSAFWGERLDNGGATSLKKDFIWGSTSRAAFPCTNFDWVCDLDLDIRFTPCLCPAEDEGRTPIAMTVARQNLAAVLSCLEISGSEKCSFWKSSFL